MNAVEAKGMLVRARVLAAQATSHAKSQAFAAGAKFARAVNAGADLRSQAQAALLARDAYWQRIGAEGEKYRATYLLLAVNERKTAFDAAVAAENAKNARDQRYTIERAKSFAVRANLLEQAADRAAAAVKDVPEPEVVSWRRAQRLATAMGMDLSRPNEQAAVAARVSPLTNAKYYSPLVDWMYTRDIRRTAGGLAGVGEAGITPGDGTAGISFLDSLKRAFGIGISEAGKAATKAGADAAKDNPGTAAVAAGAGGLLAAFASMLGVQFNAGVNSGQGMTPEGERKFPWGAVLAATAVVGAGVLVWRAR